MNLPTIALAACLLAACASAPPDDIPARSTVMLLPSHSAPLGRGAALRIDRVEDSRCPPGVQCVRAGRLRYHLTLLGAAAPESFSLDEHAPSFSSRQIPGLTVALTAPVPPQASGAASQVVALTVTRGTNKGDLR